MPPILTYSGVLRYFVPDPMSKKSRKAGKHKPKHREKSYQPPAQAGAAELLRSFKSAWDAGRWLETLGCYRSWTARTGRERQARLEAELLFRSASHFYSQGKLRVALQHLEEAAARDPEPAAATPTTPVSAAPASGSSPRRSAISTWRVTSSTSSLCPTAATGERGFPKLWPQTPCSRRGCCWASGKNLHPTRSRTVPPPPSTTSIRPTACCVAPAIPHRS